MEDVKGTDAEMRLPHIPDRQVFMKRVDPSLNAVLKVLSKHQQATTHSSKGTEWHTYFSSDLFPHPPSRSSSRFRQGKRDSVG